MTTPVPHLDKLLVQVVKHGAEVDGIGTDQDARAQTAQKVRRESGLRWCTFWQYLYTFTGSATVKQDAICHSYPYVRGVGKKLQAPTMFHAQNEIVCGVRVGVLT